MSSLPELPELSSSSEQEEYLHPDPDFQMRFPALYEYLSRVVYKGKNRAPSRLVLYYEDGQATILLTNPHTAQLLFHTCEALEEGLEGLEKRLNEDPKKGWKKDKKSRYR